MIPIQYDWIVQLYLSEIAQRIKDKQKKETIYI
jgi:hypothetical protein